MFLTSSAHSSIFVIMKGSHESTQVSRIPIDKGKFSIFSKSSVLPAHTLCPRNSASSENVQAIARSASDVRLIRELLVAVQR